MPTATLTYNSSMSSLAGGVDAVDGQGPKYTIAFSGVWAVGNGYQFQIVLAGQTFTLGQGRLTGLVPTRVITLNNRVLFVAGNNFCGSDNGDATGWETQAPGAFQTPVTNQSQQVETLVSLAPYQGKIALYSRYTTQIWSLNADPTLIALQQTLANVGANAPRGIQNVGDLDNYALGDSGVRSLRARDLTLNAYVADVGSPIDALIASDLAYPLRTDADLAGVISIVEPTSQRYWVYIPPRNLCLSTTYGITAKAVTVDGDPYTVYYVALTGLIVGNTYLWTIGANDFGVFDSNWNVLTWTGRTTNASISFVALTSTVYLASLASGVSVTATVLFAKMYVLSVFPSSKVIGWSTYTCVSSGETFLVKDMVVYNSQVYLRVTTPAGDYIVTYGLNPNSASTLSGLGLPFSDYDGFPAVMQTMFFDMKKPGHQKQSQYIDVDVTGPCPWNVQVTANWPTNAQVSAIPLTDVGALAGLAQQATFDQGIVPVQEKGTHFCVTLTSYGGGLGTKAINPASVASVILYYSLAEAPVDD